MSPFIRTSNAGLDGRVRVNWETINPGVGYFNLFSKTCFNRWPPKEGKRLYPQNVCLIPLDDSRIILLESLSFGGVVLFSLYHSEFTKGPLRHFYFRGPSQSHCTLQQWSPNFGPLPAFIRDLGQYFILWHQQWGTVPPTDKKMRHCLLPLMPGYFLFQWLQSDSLKSKGQ